MNDSETKTAAETPGKPGRTEQEYELLDSGNGWKLERLGPVVLCRPSSVCMWQTRLPESTWKKADATYQGDQGWAFCGERFETWPMTIAGVHLELRLQTNGQIGLFPEHASYLARLQQIISEIRPGPGKAPRMLNLFAYTGLASVCCAARGVDVTHVDLSKKALAWATRNLDVNHIATQRVRFICDDALKFIERERRRAGQYEVLVVDPPSFSRISKSRYWKLDDGVAELVTNCCSLLNPEQAVLAFTCHQPGISADMLANLVLDNLPKSSVHSEELALTESSSGRRMPAGSLALAWY